MDKNIRQLTVVAVLFLLSLIAAFLLFYYFESFAEIENKGVKLGGAGAGFVVFFWMLYNAYSKLVKTDDKLSGKSNEEKIRLLQEQLDSLTKSSLDNFVVPKGYIDEISTQFNFGFCYPETWSLGKFPETVNYGAVYDLESQNELQFARNFNVIITHLADNKVEIKDIAAQYHRQLLTILPKAQMLEEEIYLFQGLPASKAIVEYQLNNNNELVCYQHSVLNKHKTKVFTITFTTTKEDFDKSKHLFDNIIGTFRICEK